MYGLFKPQFYLGPSIKLNGIPLDGVKRAFLLIVSTKNENNSIKWYNASTVSLLAHCIDVLPRVLLDAVSLTLREVVFSIVAAKDIELAIWDAKYWWKESSFLVHERLFDELEVFAEEGASSTEVIIAVTSTDDEHSQTFWKMSQWREKEKALSIWLQSVLD